MWQACLHILPQLRIPENLKKNFNSGLDTRISDAKTDPFIIFGPAFFAYLKSIGVQIKEEEKLVRLQLDLDFFAKYRAVKSQFVNLVLWL